MSVSDPLIKELKAYTRILTERKSDITDDTEDLVHFCKCLEKCFRKGISMRLNAFGVPNLPDPWNCMEDLAKRRDDSLISFKSIIEDVSENQKVQETSGRLRLLIRTCLNRKCMHVPVAYLVRNPFLALNYYNTDSILGDEILGEILNSVLLQVGKLNFRLNLRNASFLDDTWDIPDFVTVEFVPCKTLGVSVCFMKGKTLIIKIEENSVAADYAELEVGDVLDEINGNVISGQTRGNLNRIMKKTACLPIRAHFVKYRNTKNDIFEPIAELIKCSGLEELKQILEKPKLSEREESDSSKPATPVKENGVQLVDVKPGYLVEYCGSIQIGCEGDVKQIERAIRKVLQPGNVNFIPVRFECLELGVKITQDSDSKEVASKNYMEISSCGGSNNFPYYFAFISGETTCNVALNFEAHVFFHKNDNEVQAILQSLGQGFYRTHFAV